jgi:hypothetical protein
MPFNRESPKLSEYTPEELELAEKLYELYRDGMARQFMFLKKWQDTPEREKIAFCHTASSLILSESRKNNT